MKSSPKFLLIRIYLLIQIIAGGFIVMALLLGTLIDGISNGFEAGKAILPVKRKLLESELTSIDASQLEWVKLTGQLETETSWISSLVLPFFNTGVYEVSFIYALFSSAIYLLLYLIFASITKENLFPYRNIKRIYIIGALMLIWPLLHFFRDRWMQSVVDNIDSRYIIDTNPQSYFFNMGIIL